MLNFYIHTCIPAHGLYMYDTTDSVLYVIFGHSLVHRSFYVPVDPTTLYAAFSDKKYLAD